MIFFLLTLVLLVFFGVVATRRVLFKSKTVVAISVGTLVVIFILYLFTQLFAYFHPVVFIMLLFCLILVGLVFRARYP